MNRTNWIDFDEWARIGQPIKSTTSVEAVQMFDAAVSQYASWFDNKSLGGLGGTLQKMQSADPNFLLGRAFQIVVGNFGFTETVYNNEQIAAQVKQLKEDADKQKDDITGREYNHVMAAVKMGYMDFKGASACWDAVLQESPLDMFALKSQLFCNFFIGEKLDNFNMIDRIYHHYDKAPTYHCEAIHGYYGFVNEEINQLEAAERLARKGLELYPWDGWTTHALTHALEKKGEFSTAKQLMDKNWDNWSRSNHLAGHNIWHLALLNVSLDNYDTAVELLDKEIVAKFRAGTGGSVTDLSAMLYQLLFLNDELGYPDEFFTSRFEDAYEASKGCHSKDKLNNPFLVNHYAMACLGSGRKSEAEEMLEDFRRSKHAEMHPEINQIGCSVLEALIYYDEGNYSKATSIMAPVRHQMVFMGASDAQREIFDQLLLTCALKSPLEEHKELFQVLVQERESVKHNNPFVGKLLKQKL